MKPALFREAAASATSALSRHANCCAALRRRVFFYKRRGLGGSKEGVHAAGRQHERAVSDRGRLAISAQRHCHPHRSRPWRSASPHARAAEPDRPRHRRDHRRGPVLADRPCGGRKCGSGGRPQLHDRRHRLRLRRHVLFRAGEHDPGVRQRLHLRLCHAGRACGLDHRLGPRARIRRGRGHRFGQLVTLRDLALPRFRHQSARAVDAFALRDRHACRWRHGTRHRQSAGHAHHRGYLRASDPGHQGVRNREFHDCGDQSRRGDRGGRGWRVLYQGAKLRAVHPARTPASSAISAGPAFFAARA